MSVKRIAALLPAVIISMLFASALCLAIMPAKAHAEVPEYEVISYELTDSYGDGWNGASISIVDTADDTQLASLTFEFGDHAEGTVSLTWGHDYRFVWNAGSYDSECSFTLKIGEATLYEGSGSDLHDHSGEAFFTRTAGQGMPIPYDLWIADTRVFDTNAADVLGDGTVSYDADTKTLTLDNCACIRSGGDNALIYAGNDEGPITINLKGNSVLEGGTGDQYGIYASAGATFTGDGSLTVIGGGSANSFGIYSLGTITLDGSFSGTVVAKGVVRTTAKMGRVLRRLGNQPDFPGHM